MLGIIGLLKLLCSNNVEMSFLSALMVYSSVNNLSVISGRFINFLVNPVLSRTYKASSQRTQHIGPVESRTSGHSDTTHGYIGDLQLKLFNL